jgi:uncharacterized membrane protein
MTRAATRLSWLLMTALSAAVAIYSYRYLPRVGLLAPNVLDNRLANPWLDLHVAGAATGLVLGPLQFIAALRRRSPGLHRALGRVYIAGCLVGATGGFALALGATAGPVATVGFGLLALFWAGATLQAWRLALQRRFAQHRVWMMRSFALTFAAVSLRLGLAALPLLRVDFLDGYRALSFLSWMVNLAILEFALIRFRTAT